MPKRFKSILILSGYFSGKSFKASHVGSTQTEFRLKPLANVFRNVTSNILLRYRGTKTSQTEIIEQLKDAAQ